MRSFFVGGDELILDRELANQIVHEMMKVIPYNINVMNHYGVIIGSGDKKRLGQRHDGAIEAIHSKRMIEINENSENAKKGVNEPIIDGHEVIGVVGITGEPDEVRPFSRLVRAATLLLINQERHLKADQEAMKRKEEFLFEWFYKKQNYGVDFVESAKKYDVDLTQRHGIIWVNFRKAMDENDIKRRFYLGNVLKLEAHQMAWILSESEWERAEKILDKQREYFRKASKSRLRNQLDQARKEARKTLELGQRILPSENIYEYDMFKFFLEINYERHDRLENHLNRLHSAGDGVELIKTLQYFIESNGEMNMAAKKLNIHRNTLSYRLDKIYEITKKHPKKLLDLMELTTALCLSEDYWANAQKTSSQGQ
jgi:carbohydrate diacid regulator